MNTEKIKKILQNKALRTVVVCLLAFLLLLAVWRVFFKGEEETSAYQPTALEQRLALLIEEIEGVERATVMIAEEDGSVTGAVVIIKGDMGLVTRTRVVDAAAYALNVARQKVLIYPADKS